MPPPPSATAKASCSDPAVPNGADFNAARRDDQAGNVGQALDLYRKISQDASASVARVVPGIAPGPYCGHYSLGTRSNLDSTRGIVGGARAALGLHYEKGQGVPKDDAAAAKWYELAVRDDAENKPDATAGLHYAFMLANGRGVAVDKPRAKLLFETFGARQFAARVDDGTLGPSFDQPSGPAAGTRVTAATPAQGSQGSRVTLFGVGIGQDIQALPKCSALFQNAGWVNLALFDHPRPGSQCIVVRTGGVYGLVLTQAQLDEFPWMKSSLGVSVGGSPGNVGDVEMQAGSGRIEQMTIRTGGPCSKH